MIDKNLQHSMHLQCRFCGRKNRGFGMVRFQNKPWFLFHITSLPVAITAVTIVQLQLDYFAAVLCSWGGEDAAAVSL